MTGLLIALFLMAENPYAKYAPKNAFDDLVPKEQLSAGPHTLVVSDGTSMTRMDYNPGLFAPKREMLSGAKLPHLQMPPG